MENLSHLVPSLLGGDSMTDGNTISTPPAFSPAGSASEASRGESAGDPNPVIPATPAAPTVLHPSGSPRSDPWTRADGSPWRSSSGTGTGWAR